MAKIRGVKPELWTDENFVELSPFARLLWIGLWNHACDNGHLQDKSKQIKMRVLPTDDVNCAELLREIEGQQLIEREAGWITIPNLSHHQKPHKRWFVVCDKDGCDHPEGTSYGFQKANPKPETTVDQPLNNRDQPLNNGGSTADVDCDVDVDVDVEVDLNTLSDESDDRFDEFWNIYGKKDGRKTALARWKSALKKRGVTADMLIASAAKYIDWQRREGKHPTYTKLAATWLNGEHWNDELHTEAPSNVRTLRHASEIESPPDGLTDDEYAQWEYAQRMKRNGGKP